MRHVQLMNNEEEWQEMDERWRRSKKLLLIINLFFILILPWILYIILYIIVMKSVSVLFRKIRRVLLFFHLTLSRLDVNRGKMTIRHPSIACLKALSFVSPISRCDLLDQSSSRSSPISIECYTNEVCYECLIRKLHNWQALTKAGTDDEYKN